MQLAAPPSPEEVVSYIARSLGGHPRVLRVILIGSRARGDARADSDYDVVVELDADPLRAAALGRDLESLIPRRGWELNLICSARGEIERWAHDPGRIEWDVMRQGRVLYAANGDYELRLPPRRVREGPPESLADWVFRARQDREAADVLLARGLWDHAAYHSQQSGEKYLKALLVKLNARPARTHVLEHLLSDLRALGVELGNLDADCTFLSRFAVPGRYGIVHASEAQARLATEAAVRVGQAAELLLAL